MSDETAEAWCRAWNKYQPAVDALMRECGLTRIEALLFMELNTTGRTLDYIVAWFKRMETVAAKQNKFVEQAMDELNDSEWKG